MHGRTIVITRSGCRSAQSWHSRSDSVLSRAYSKSGTPRTGQSSSIGTGLSGNAPYAVADVELRELDLGAERPRRPDVGDRHALDVLTLHQAFDQAAPDVPGAAGDHVAHGP